MTQRIHGLVLIGLLLGGTPVRAAEAGSAPAAHVQIGAIAPGRLEAVRAKLISSGAEVRLVVTGRGVRLSLVARSRRALDAALGELAAAAGPGGLKIRILTGQAQELHAVATKSTSLDAPRPSRGGSAPAAVHVRADRTVATDWRWLPRHWAPPFRWVAAPSAQGSRGPPA